VFLYNLVAKRSKHKMFFLCSSWSGRLAGEEKGALGASRHQGRLDDTGWFYLAYSRDAPKHRRDVVFWARGEK
jgi:hypothetical protein